MPGWKLPSCHCYFVGAEVRPKLINYCLVTLSVARRVCGWCRKDMSGAWNEWAHLVCLTDQSR